MTDCTHVEPAGTACVPYCHCHRRCRCQASKRPSATHSKTCAEFRLCRRLNYRPGVGLNLRLFSERTTQRLSGTRQASIDPFKKERGLDGWMDGWMDMHCPRVAGNPEKWPRYHELRISIPKIIKSKGTAGQISGGRRGRGRRAGGVRRLSRRLLRNISHP